MESLAVALFLAVAVKAILDYIAQPIRTKYPTLDLWWFDYLALAAGFVVAWFANIDIYAPFIPDNSVLTRILTAVTVGGGAKLINDIFANAPLKDDYFAERHVRGVEIAPPPASVAVTRRPRGW